PVVAGAACSATKTSAGLSRLAILSAKVAVRGRTRDYLSAEDQTENRKVNGSELTGTNPEM
ncbi:MAG: hypothetical protein WCS27_06675, partial [Victivallaceae bacterium]